jgi:hypothetical protein
MAIDNPRKYACIAIDDVAECPCRYRFNASVHIACSLNGLLD